MAFVTLSFAQLVHLGNARSGSSLLSIARATGNPYALAALGLSLALQILAVHLAPLARLLGAVRLDGQDWLVAMSFGAIPAVVGEGIKLTRGKVTAQSARERG
jgi:magnesium-transporting ATPase (P-type)